MTLLARSGICFATFLFNKKTVMPTEHISAADFKNKIFDYETEQDWKYKGTLPAIIDFYAEWCGPCKAIAPVLEELSEEYAGKVIIYKIDTDQEEELSSLFGIQSIPTILFIPLQGSLMVQRGALPKNVLKQVIEEKLLIEIEQ
jgi:thioredoxin 1